MKKKGKKNLLFGGILIATFLLWTALIQMVDVHPLGQNGTNIGFATFNCWFHRLTDVHMTIYTITDWLGLVPLGHCRPTSTITPKPERPTKRIASLGTAKNSLKNIVTS